MERANAVIVTPGLDILSVGEPLIAIPANVLGVDWDEIVYREPVEIRVRTADGDEISFGITEMSLNIDRDNCTAQQLQVLIERDDYQWLVSFDPHRDSFFEFTEEHDETISVRYGDDELSFTEFLNEYPLHFYFADFSRLRGEEWFPCAVPAEPFDRNTIQVLPWQHDGVLIQKEYWKADDHREAGQFSIHEYLENHLLGQENSVIFYDHRSGEAADLLVLAELPNAVTLSLYHCKGSGGENPGDRVDDVYEVCGQVIKSFNLIDNPKDLLKHVRRRAASGSRFARGDVEQFERLVLERGPRPLKYEFIVVQPGISKALLSENSGAVLAAADEYVANIGASNFVVLSSE
jgi:hypothetical protein